MMLAEKVRETLVERGPLTMGQLERALGVPRTLLRTTLVPEFYEQREIDHPQHGRVTAWVPRANGLLRINGADETYSLALPKVEPPKPEPPVLKPEEGTTYVDDHGRRMKVATITPTRITGHLLDGSEHEDKPYSTDAPTFRAVWKAAA